MGSKVVSENKTTGLLFEQCPYYIYYHIHTARCEPCLKSLYYIRYMYIAQCVYIHRHTRAPRKAV